MTDRVAALRALAAKKPGDPKIHYALGLELRKRGESGGALDAFLDAVRADPDYTAAYVAAGEVYAAEARRDAAREIWVRGVAAARRKGALRTRLHIERLIAALEQGGPPASRQPERRDRDGTLPSGMRPVDGPHVSRPLGFGREPRDPRRPRRR